MNDDSLDQCFRAALTGHVVCRDYAPADAGRDC